MMHYWMSQLEAAAKTRRDRVPLRGVSGSGVGAFRQGPGWSDDHCGQSDEVIIAQSGHGF